MDVRMQPEIAVYVSHRSVYFMDSFGFWYGVQCSNCIYKCLET
jgi:hypothetical protein